MSQNDSPLHLPSTSYKVLSVASSISPCCVRETAATLAERHPYEFRTHQFFPLLYLENEFRSCAEPSFAQEKTDSDNLLVRINRFVDVPDTPLWRFRSLVALANLKQARDWSEVAGRPAEIATQKLLDQAISVEHIPEALLFRAMLEEKQKATTARVRVAQADLESVVLQMREEERSRIRSAKSGAVGAAEADDGEDAAEDHVLGVADRQQLKTGGQLEEGQVVGGPGHGEGHHGDEDDHLLRIEASHDVEWLLAQLRAGEKSQDRSSNTAEVDALLATLSEADHAALWKLYDASLQSCVATRRPVVDLNGRETLPAGFYEWEVPGNLQAEGDTKIVEEANAGMLGGGDAPRPSAGLGGGPGLYRFVVSQIRKESDIEIVKTEEKPSRGVSTKNRVRAVCEQPEYFAIVSEKAKFWEDYVDAVERKGFVSRRQKANGIKFDRGLVKIKIHQDMRLWTDVVWKNRFGNYLVLFNKEDDHGGVERAKRLRGAGARLRYEIV